MKQAQKSSILHLSTKRDRMDQMCYPLLTEEAHPKTAYQDLNLDRKIEQLGDISMYINIPFCDWICHFCPYTKYKTPKNEALKAYVSCLKKELQMYGDTDYAKNSQIGAIYFGGGTPTCLSANDLSELLDACHKHFNLSDYVEITIEGSPVNLTLEKIAAVKQHGANRISLGLQSFDMETLKMLGTPLTHDETFQCIENARQVGIKNINIDLMYAMPGQTFDSWKKDLQLAMDIHPYSFSLFPLALVPGTPLFVKVQNGKFPQPPDLDDEYSMYRYALETLTQNGYQQHCAMDFALEKQESKHVALYHSAVDAIAIGAGSYGYINCCMYVNSLSIENYINSISYGQLPIAYLGRADTKQKRMERKLILNLKLMKIDKQEFKNIFDVEVEESFAEIFMNMKQKGVIESDDKYVRLTEAGVFWTNDVCRGFFPKEYQNYKPRQFFKSKSDVSADT
jgi:oxygen-independent coproporphyrinogen-3 oxidase